MIRTEKRRFIIWQQITLWLLLLGYTGYYFCRSNFAVVKPVLLEEFGQLGLDLSALGLISSAGMLAYVAGKLFLGPLTDYVGGKWIFMLGMCGSVLATVYFGLGVTLGGLMIAWGLNRFFQAAGWGAMVQLTTHWVSYKSYGKAMGMLSLSYLFGDSLVRYILGSMLNDGYGWRGIMLASAAILAFISLLTWLFLRSSPGALGLPETRLHPANLFEPTQEQTQQAIADNFTPKLHVFQLLGTYFKSLSFWLIAFMSLGLTVMRETFNEWSNTFLVEFSDFTPGAAAQISAIFPLIGGIAGLLYGFLSDWTRRFRGILVGGAQLALATIFLGVYFGGHEFHIEYTSVFMAVVALLLVGPYTYLAGVFVMELSGRKGGASAAALVDSVGYLGSVFAGYGVAYIAQKYDWRTVFLFLGILALATAVAGGVFWFRRERLYSTLFGFLGKK